ncbi:MAG: Ig-like domain-containing protein [Clostridia bacterium]|nr:Ig-like domain-containing protein [Clostridia bacterium]
MKKQIIAVVTLVLIICCAIGLAACDKDNDNIDITGIELDRDDVTLAVGEDITLVVTVTPSYATNLEMDWLSSNTSVATVDSGSVVAIAEGTATITVTTYNDFSASCTVTVLPEEEDDPIQYTVIFNANGGKMEDGTDGYIIAVDEFSKIPTVKVSRGDDYEFIGWFRDEYCTRPWDIDEDEVNDDITLYAGWKYLNPYQSVIDALEDKVKAERNDNSLQVEILLVFVNDGNLCFVEKDKTGVFSYATDINNFDKVAGNATLIAKIPNSKLTLIKNYNDTYTSDNNAYIADEMANKYLRIYFDEPDSDYIAPVDVIFSCVSQWEDDGINHYPSTVGPNYSCKVRAIVVDKNGIVHDCSFIVVTGVKVTNDNAEAIFGSVLGGPLLSEEFDFEQSELGDIASDFYAERVKEWEA